MKFRHVSQVFIITPFNANSDSVYWSHQTVSR